MTDFIREEDPWKRIERNINIRAEAAKREIAKMASLIIAVRDNQETLQQEFRLLPLLSVLKGEVVDLNEYKKRKEKGKVRIPLPLNVDPYGVYTTNYFGIGKTTFTSQPFWRHSPEPTDDKDKR